MKLTTDTVSKTLAAINEIAYGASIKSSSTGRYDFFAGRLRAACTSGKLLSTITKFGDMLGSQVLRSATVQGLMSAVAAEDSRMVYLWLREQPTIAISMAMAGNEDKLQMIADFCAAYDPVAVKPARMKRRRPFNITIAATLENAFTHGDDKKAGNNTLFRRGMVRGGSELPYYSANAWGGQMRDMFAAHFITTLGYDLKNTEKLFAPWFLHLLTSGGIMADGAIPKSFETVLTGGAGAMKVDGAIQLRNMIPFFSMMGGVGKYPMEGRVYINDLRPQCIEWGNGDESIEALMDWRYIVNRDDLENRVSKAKIKENKSLADRVNRSMPANIECIVEGVVMEGGIDIDRHITDMELSALAKGLEMMREFGYLGGKVHRGFGRVTIEYLTNSNLTLDGTPYDKYLADNKRAIIDYVQQIGGFAVHKTQATPQAPLFEEA